MNTPMERIGPGPRIPRIVYVAVAVLLLLIFGRSICELILDYQWWTEMGQVSTWIRMNEYRYLPGIGAWLLVWVILFVAHARGLKYAGVSLSMFPIYTRIAIAASPAPRNTALMTKISMMTAFEPNIHAVNP